MIDFENWVAEISSKYGVDIYKKTEENLSLGCVPLEEGLEYAKKLKISFTCYEMSSEEKKIICKELNELVGKRLCCRFGRNTPTLSAK